MAFDLFGLKNKTIDLMAQNKIKQLRLNRLIKKIQQFAK